MKWQVPTLLLITVAIALVLSVRTEQIPLGPADPGCEQGDITHARSATQQPGAVRLEVGDNFQQVVDANPPGTRFLIASDIHRMQRVLPKDDMVFTGEPGAVMSGARVLDLFTQEGGLWVANGQTQQGVVHPCDFPQGCMLPGHERDDHLEELFIDGERMRHISSKSQVGPGRWFFDYDTNKIYIGNDPAGRLVETSVTDHAFHGDASGVVIENLTVRHYANHRGRGAIHGRDGRDWTIRYVHASHNHGAGISLGPGHHLHNSRVTCNGQIGFRASAGGEAGLLRVEHNEIAHNRQLGYNWGWEGGAMKILSTQKALVRNNWVHHNGGPGIWFDYNNRDTTIVSNRVEHNEAIGIFYEVSYGPTEIYWNIVRHNGKRQPGAGGAGIRISNSSDVDVYENAVDTNERGIMLTMMDRPEHVELENVKVRDNDIRMLTGTTGLVDETGNEAYYTSEGNVFEGNTYRIDDPDGRWFSWTGGWSQEYKWTEWQEHGNDGSGSIDDALAGPNLPDEAVPFVKKHYGPQPSGRDFP